MGQDYGFDTFLMERWGGSEPADEKQRRHAAFRALQKKLKIVILLRREPFVPGAASPKEVNPAEIKCINWHLHCI